MKHPALRVSAWQWIAPEYQALIAEAIVDLAVPTLPFQPARVELVGSMVRGCAHLDSDFDLNLAANDWNEQVEWRRIWDERSHRSRFLAALQPLMDDLGIRIEVAPNNPDQRTYDTCYDFLTGSLSNAGRAFPDWTARWWDGYLMQWRERPLFQKSLEFSRDEWPHGLREMWRSIYGRRYLMYQTLPLLGPDGDPLRLQDGTIATKLVAGIRVDGE